MHSKVPKGFYFNEKYYLKKKKVPQGFFGSLSVLKFIKGFLDVI